MSTDGYRVEPAGGPRLRTDVVDVYVVRQGGPGMGPAVLQLLRAEEPLRDTWHPVMGHVERGETASACALRELEEELGLRRGDGALLGVWALEQVHPFFVAPLDTIVLSPRFAALVAPGWEPPAGSEHSAARWITPADIDAMFLWPGQRSACREALEVVQGTGPAARVLRLDQPRDEDRASP